MTRGAPKEPGATLVLRLYLAGDSPNSALARANLRAAIAHLSPSEVSLEIVDVLHDPMRAMRDQVLLTPTLIRVSPRPELRIVGNLRTRDVLCAGLGIAEASRG